MSFPQTPLDVLVEVFLGADRTADPSTWVPTDATALVFDRDEDEIGITRGRHDQSGTADPSTLSMTGDNREGHWATRNALSPWFGQLRKGTPVRVTVEGNVRYTGFFSELPPRWDVTGRLRWVPLKALGLLYDLALEGAPELSAMRRSTAAAEPSAYWPLEDGPDSTTAGSALDGGTKLIATAAPLFGAAVAAAGVVSGVSFATDDSLAGPTGIAAGPAPNGWEIEFGIGFLEFPTGNPTGNRYTVMKFSTPGSIVFEVGIVLINDIFVPTQYNIGVQWIDADGGLSANYDTASPLVVGQMYHLRSTWTQDGSNIRWTYYLDGVQIYTTAFEAGTLYAPTQVSINTPSFSTLPANADIASLAVWTPVRGSAPTYAALNGYLGEAAHTRFARLCAEEGVPGTCAATESIAMGSQLPDAFLPLLRDLEASDQGFLYEGLDFGVTYQAHTERENMTPALELDYLAAGHVSPPLEPTDDAQDVRNDVTVTREGGSSARVEEDPEAEFGRKAIGRRKDDKKYSLANDDLPLQVAGWRLHMLTWPGYRWPVITINLAAAPSLIDDLAAADLAFRLTIANPPADAGSSTIDVIVDGSEEGIKQFDWIWRANANAYGPWRVGTLANTTSDTSEYLLRLVPDTCYLVGAVDDNDTSLLVFADPRWTTVADDFPVDVRFGGELVTLTSVASVGTDAFGRTVSAGSLGSATSGQAYTLVGTAGDYSVNGSRGRVLPTTLTSDYKAVIDAGSTDVNLTADLSNSTLPASGSLRMGLIARYSSTSNFYHCEAQVGTDGRVTLRIIKRVSAVLTLVTSVTTGVLNPGGNFVTMRFVVVGDRLRARVWPLGGTEPSVWYIDIVDTALTSGTNVGFFFRNDSAATTHVFLVDNLDVAEPKTWAVTRSVNGVAKSHAALTTGEIDDPSVLGL